jgi:hypothetical protein
MKHAQRCTAMRAVVQLQYTRDKYSPLLFVTAVRTVLVLAADAQTLAVVSQLQTCKKQCSNIKNANLSTFSCVM